MVRSVEPLSLDDTTFIRENAAIFDLQQQKMLRRAAYGFRKMIKKVQQSHQQLKQQPLQQQQQQQTPPPPPPRTMTDPLMTKIELLMAEELQKMTSVLDAKEAAIDTVCEECLRSQLGLSAALKQAERRLEELEAKETSLCREVEKCRKYQLKDHASTNADQWKVQLQLGELRVQLNELHSKFAGADVRISAFEEKFTKQKVAPIFGSGELFPEKQLQSPPVVTDKNIFGAISSSTSSSRCEDESTNKRFSSIEEKIAKPKDAPIFRFGEQAQTPVASNKQMQNTNVFGTITSISSSTKTSTSSSLRCPRCSFLDIQWPNIGKASSAQCKHCGYDVPGISVVDHTKAMEFLIEENVDNEDSEEVAKEQYGHVWAEFQAFERERCSTHTRRRRQP